MSLCTSTGCYQFPFEDTFKILGCALNPEGKMHDAMEERMQSANKAFCEDILIFKSKDVQWKVKCQRLVDHVCAMQSLRLGVKIGCGPYRRWKRSKDGKPRQ